MRGLAGKQCGANLMAVFVACVGLTALAGCGSSSEETSERTSCTSNYGCAEDERCYKRECVKKPEGYCEVDSDCSGERDSECQGSELVIYDAVCQGGGMDKSCAVVPVSMEYCSYGCEDGECDPGPCGETCSNPPAPTCDGEYRARVYESAGQCVEEECRYPSSTEFCEWGCEAGRCKENPCTAESCQSPAPPHCEGNTLVVEQLPGECRVDGTEARCDYGTWTEDCDYAGATCNVAEVDCIEPIEQSGDVVITEYMAHPGAEMGVDGEWFEVLNASGRVVDLNGWTIESGRYFYDDESHLIDESLEMPPGGRLVFAASADPAGDGSDIADYVYEGIELEYASDWIQLSNPQKAVADYVFWEEGSVIEGLSRMLDPDVQASASNNDSYGNWCPELKVTYGGAAFAGTPGGSNSSCERDPCAYYACKKPDDYCTRDGKLVQHTADEASGCARTPLNNPRCDYGRRTVECGAGEMCMDGNCE